MFVHKRDGFTLIEMMVVVGIAAVLSAFAVPAFDQWTDNQRAKSAIRSLANAFNRARSDAIRTGSNHIVFFQADAQGNTLVDSDGAAVPVVVVNDDRPGGTNQNCVIDAGETVAIVRVETGLNWGVTIASAGVPTDFGTGSIGTGSSFTEPNGNPATWVLFRPDGTPVAFAPDCTIGVLGSGTGAAYLTNGVRDYAAVVTALGGIRVHAWENQSAQWTN